MGIQPSDMVEAMKIQPRDTVDDLGGQSGERFNDMEGLSDGQGEVLKESNMFQLILVTNREREERLVEIRSCGYKVVGDGPGSMELGIIQMLAVAAATHRPANDHCQTGCQSSEALPCFQTRLPVGQWSKRPLPLLRSAPPVKVVRLFCYHERRDKLSQ